MAFILIFGTLMIAVAIAFLLTLIIFFIRDKNKWIDDFVNNHDDFNMYTDMYMIHMLENQYLRNMKYFKIMNLMI